MKKKLGKKALAKEAAFWLGVKSASLQNPGSACQK